MVTTSGDSEQIIVLTGSLGFFISKHQGISNTSNETCGVPILGNLKSHFMT